MFTKALLTLSLVSAAFATVYVTSPTSQTTLSGGSTGVVVWQDDGNSPSLATFGPATVGIYTGNAVVQSNLKTLETNIDVSKVTTFNFTVDPGLGPDNSHYFMRFQSNSGKSDNGTAFLAFSAQFTLTNMTGTFSPAILSEIAGQTSAPLGGQTVPASASSTSTPSLTKSTGTASSTSSTAKPTSGATGIKAGWAGLVLGAVVGITMF